MGSPEILSDLLIAGKKRKGAEEAYQKLLKASPQCKRELDNIYHQPALNEADKEALKGELARILPKADLSKLNFDVYFELLPYARLMHSFEDNGQPERHAYQLALLFNNKDKALKYLDTYNKNHNEPELLMHDACNFALPDGSYDLKVWQDICQKFLDDDQFRKSVLPHASGIEKLIKTSSQAKKPKPEDVKKATTEIEPIIALFRELEKHHGELDSPSNRKLVEKVKDTLNHLLENKEISEEDLKIETPEMPQVQWGNLDEEEEDNAEINAAELELYYQILQKYILKKQIALSKIGVAFNNQLTLPMLNAFNAGYLSSSTSSAHTFFLQNGLTTRSYAKFIKLKRQDDDRQIPNIKIDGAHLGYPGFYLMKVPVLDEMQAARAACFGKLTRCCQSMSGESGEPCVIHGLTSPFGGFYVLCQGDITDPKHTDKVVAQSWTWRSKNNAIVLDSVEVANSEPNTKKMVRDFYDNLAKTLVDNNHTNKVAVGASNSGISKEVGISSNLNTKEEFVDYEGYSDSANQLVLYENDKPFYLYGRNETATALAISFIEKGLNEDPFSANFQNALEWAILAARDDYLDTTRELAQKNSPECEKRLNNALLSIYEHKIVPKALEQYEQHITEQGKSREEYTPLHFAIEYKLAPFALALVAKKDYNHIAFKGGDSVLLSSIEQIQYEPKMKAVAKALIEQGTDIHAKALSPWGGGYTALHRAIRGNHFDLALSLLEKGASFETTNMQNQTPWQALIDAAKEDNSTNNPDFTKLIQTVVQKGAPLETTNEKEHTMLVSAVLGGNLALVRCLLASGADFKSQVKDHAPIFYSDFRNEFAADIVLAFVEYGLDINLQDGAGNNFLMYMILTQDYSPQNLIKLLDAGVNINTPTITGETPLIKALTFFPKIDKTQFILTLLEKGADINAKGPKGESVLILAARYNTIPVVQKLLQLGAKIDEKEKEAFDALLEKNAPLREVYSMQPKTTRPQPIVFASHRETEKQGKEAAAPSLEAERRKGPAAS